MGSQNLSECIMTVLEEHADFRNRADQDGISSLLLFDQSRDQYMVVDTGWLNYQAVRTIVLFVRIIDGKIWIEEDWTEYGIADKLVECGIPHNSIVLGFKHPELRPFTDFAVV